MPPNPPRHRPRPAVTLSTDTLRTWLGERVLAWPDPAPLPATGVRCHSDRLRPGDLFIAMGGASTHGLRFAEAALARGAVGVLSDRPFPGAIVVDDAGAALLTLGRAARAALAGPVVAVTGSAGKTTTKALLRAALDAPGSPGNHNTPHALAEVLVDAALAPGPPRPLVLELGIDHAGEMAGLTDLVRPTHGLVTLIAEAHLEGLGDLARVAMEKAGVLRAAATRRYASAQAWAHLPAELQRRTHRYRVAAGGSAGAFEEAAARDAAARDAAARDAAAQDAANTGGAHDAGSTIGRHEAAADQDLLVVDLGGARWRVVLPGPGRALAENALGALRVAVDLGVAPALAVERLSSARLEPGRLTVHERGGRRLIDDSYNANPASVAAALEVLARGPRPRALVFGSMLELGPAGPDLHRAVGRACRDLGLDVVWAVGAEARATADACPGARTFVDAAEAVAAAGDLPAGGTLLVKGSRGVGLDALVRRLQTPEEEGPWTR